VARGWQSGGMQRTPQVRRGRSPGQQARILAEYQRSGLTQREFAARAGIGYSTLTLWLRKAAANPSEPSVFVPVPNLFSSTAVTSAYRLVLPKGVIVEVATGFESAELSALLQVVQAL